MKHDPLEHQTLADKAFERLLDAITDRTLAPGDRISEAELARSFGISRGPLREAVRRLEGRGLVEYRPRIGARVKTFTVQDMIDCFSIREVLEGLAAAEAASRMTDGEIEECEALLGAHGEDKQVRDGTAYFQRAGAEDFHVRVVQGARNERLSALLCRDLYFVIRVFRYRSSQRKGRASEALAEHRAILQAIRDRDPAEAEARMRRHVRNARDILEAEMRRRDSQAA